ncbi:hypothetical protein BMK76_004189 [Escherichia coli]|nr:hypothetical protein [Escherichia coli]
MDTKDIISLVGVIISAITAPVGVYKLFKDASWFFTENNKILAYSEELSGAY